MKLKIKKEIRKKRVRFKIRKNFIESICIKRTSKNIYAQILSTDRRKVLVSASSLDKDIKKNIENIKLKPKPMDIAKRVGLILAKRAKKIGVGVTKKISFDRSGFKYYGRIKELAEGARKGGLLF
ncbi:50S ribosomal protein L18 [Candidatus Portiera aleyrodidarum]|uniref:Large ribosomal subunit protein uL18 n=1 Tax=Candidatus Portiera aleyrodidarum TaxID=91844 RepID=A0A6S6RS15_9GAMM|nr:50S ribosomal protein L18 [Candidatus Portiera aleyrodidarum]CAA3705168.1 50S ribosomal protein L18 [Candidatus Portiera aleyrodidarum]